MVTSDETGAHALYSPRASLALGALTRFEAHHERHEARHHQRTHGRNGPSVGAAEEAHQSRTWCRLVPASR